MTSKSIRVLEDLLAAVAIVLMDACHLNWIIDNIVAIFLGDLKAD